MKFLAALLSIMGINMGPVCPCCNRRTDTLERRRLPTKYEDEDRNWLLSCIHCYDDIAAYWEERWADYYRDVM